MKNKMIIRNVHRFGTVLFSVVVLLTYSLSHPVTHCISVFLSVIYTSCVKTRVGNSRLAKLKFPVKLREAKILLTMSTSRHLAGPYCSCNPLDLEVYCTS